MFENAALTYSAVDPYNYPIPDDTYDIVIADQVLEHVEKVWVWIKELARICRPGGQVIVINPIGYPYHGNESCGDYWRVYPEGMRTLYDKALHVELSVCESLEVSGYRRYWPRYSFVHYPRWMQWGMRGLGHFGFPIVCKMDTITIGTKP